MNEATKELQRVVAALDSLRAAGFPISQIKATADRLGIAWVPSGQ